MTSRVDSFAFHPVPLLPGEEYTYTVWAKAERPAEIEMGLYLGNGAGLSRMCPVGTGWTKLELHVPAWGAGDSVRNREAAGGQLPCAGRGADSDLRRAGEQHGLV